LIPFGSLFVVPFSLYEVTFWIDEKGNKIETIKKKKGRKLVHRLVEKMLGDCFIYMDICFG